MRVLIITSEWPTSEHPEWVPFLVQRVRFLEKASVDVQVFAFRGKKNPLMYLRAWWHVRKLYWTDDFDIVHAEFGQSGIVAIPTAQPLVVTYRGSDLQGYLGAGGTYTFSGILLRQAGQFVARFAQEIIVVSDHLVTYLKCRKAVHVIPSGIDLEKFQPSDQIEARKHLKLPLNKPLVLFGANPENPIKRFELAREACDRAIRDIELELVILSGVSHDQVPIYMNACDVLILTSKNEGSPNVVKEALACRLPIVSVDVGDVRERLENVEGCIVCRTDDPPTIARALVEVLQSRTRLELDSDILADLSEEVLTNKVISVYRQALGL